MSRYFPRFIAWFSFAVIVVFAGCERRPFEEEQHDQSHGTIGHLYVLNQTSRTIFIYEDSGLTRIDSIGSAIPEPHWLQYDPAGKYYYVVARVSPGQLAKFDAKTNALVQSITMPGNVFPTCLAISPDGKYGYLCDFTLSYTPGHIHKYDLANMTLVDSTFSNGAASHDLMFTQDGSKLVAVSRNTDDMTVIYFPGDSVAVIPLDSNNIRPNPAVYGPYGVHIDHRDSLAYVNCLFNGQVRIVDLHTRQVVDSVLIPFTAGCGYAPAGPTMSAISHDDSKLFITTQCGNSLAVVSTQTRQVIANIPFGIDRPFGVKMNHDGSRVYVACANVQDQPGWIYVIDGNNLVKIDSFSVGLNSYGLYLHEQ